MFDNMLVSLMVMLFLSFIGLLIMFLFILRSISQQNQLIKEASRQQLLAISELERQMMHLDFLVRQLAQPDSVVARNTLNSPVSANGNVSSLLEGVSADVFSAMQISQPNKVKAAQSVSGNGSASIPLDDLALSSPKQGRSSKKEYLLELK